MTTNRPFVLVFELCNTLNLRETAHVPGIEGGREGRRKGGREGRGEGREGEVEGRGGDYM